MRAVIFDFDGVVVDSQYHWDNNGTPHIQAIVPTWTRAHAPLLKGHNNVGCYKILSEQFGLTISPAEFDEHVHRFAHKVYHELAQATDGVTALLERLRHFVPTPSIASAGHLPWIETALGRLNLREHFGLITTSSEVAKSKPAPDVYLKAAEKARVAPGDCLVIEDTDAGVAAGVAAGMTVIAFHPAGQDWQEMSLAHHHIHHFDELTASRLQSLLA